MADQVDTSNVEKQQATLASIASTEVQALTEAIKGLEEYMKLDFSEYLTGIKAPDYTVFDKAQAILSALQDKQPKSDLQINWISYQSPVLPDIIIAEMPTVDMPVNDYSPTAINLPGRPSATINATLPTAPNISLDVTKPARPTITYPTLPTINLNIVLPDVPNLVFPAFNSVAPFYNLVPPAGTIVNNETLFTSTLFTDAKAAMDSDIINGGVGILAQEESDMWTRAKDRQTAITDKEMSEILYIHAMSGFAIPPGATAGALLAAAQKGSAAMAGLSNEINIKVADSKIQARQFAVQQAGSFYTAETTYHAGFWERALNAQRYILDAMINVFNAQVEGFKAQISAYQADAEVYKVQMEGIIARVNVYKTQLEGVKLQAEVAMLPVELYKAQLSGIESMVQTYKSDIESLKAWYEMNLTILKVYESQIKGYEAALDTKKVEFDIYKMAIEGESAKLQIDDLKLKGIETRTRTAQVQIDANKAVWGVKIDTAKMDVDMYRARVESSRTALEADIAQTESELKKYAGEVSAYNAIVNATGKAWELWRDISESDRTIALKTIEQNIEIAKAQVTSAAKSKDIGLAAADGIIRVHSQLANAYASGLQTFAGIIKTTDQ